ncbi:hypothetical protein SP36_54 [Salmonella phage 36]|uniref:Uncharacterized protein n=1 Tax=Salmonella phage 36 TaxID=1654889 RepID=A0A0N7CFE7_9CAUD|nr:hypothetical protein SP36_54 [Salmonella phage 36]AKJ74026.1 hypothetical protein SP36_54 [Salmonella phage 36]
MQTTNTNGIGVTQFNGMKPRHTISLVVLIGLYAVMQLIHQWCFRIKR